MPRWHGYCPTEGRLVLIIVGSALTAIALFGLAVRALSFARQPMQAIASFAGYLLAMSLLALIVVAFSRSWIAIALTAVVMIICVAAESSLFIAAKPPSGGRPLVVMTSNFKLGQVDATDVVRLVREHRVDVLTAQELTAGSVERLHAAGLDNLLEYSEIAAGAGATGVGIWSRYPLSEAHRPVGFTFNIVSARIAIPGVVPAPTVIDTHLAGPWPNSADLWAADIHRLIAILQQSAAGNPPGAVLVGGDFNATPDTAQFRRLLTGGFCDAADQAGAGITRTYPSDTWYPPLIAIDHVLTRNAVATSASTVTVRGSDHRALLVTVSLPIG